MAPNIEKLDPLPVNNHAAVFTEESNGKNVPEASLESSADDSGFISLRRNETAEFESNVQSSTQGRFSYQLDKYSKNAMLIFHIDCYRGSNVTVEHVKTVFEKFRFEVEVHHNITGDRVRAVCEEFFNRDFSEYGAVAVVVLAPVYIPYGKYYSRLDNTMTFFDNDDIIKYFYEAIPPTLVSKPKILLTQEDIYFTRSNRALDLGTQNDVFELRLVSRTYSISTPDDNYDWLVILN